MRFLLLFILATPALAEEHCSKLTDIVKRLETSLMSKQVDGCSDIKSQDFVAKAPTDFQDKVLSKGYTEAGGKDISPAKCLKLSTLETRIKEIENRLTLLEGFEKLKGEIQDQKNKASSNNLNVAADAGKSFSEDLLTAQSFDLLLNSTDASGKTFLEDMAGVSVEKRSNAEDFKYELKKFCDTGSKLSICAGPFAPTDNTVIEINEVLKAGVTAEKLQEWKTAIAITKKDGTEYSFSQMYADLSSGLAKVKDNSSSFSKDELKVIQNLPEFVNKKSNLKFIDDIAQAKAKASMDGQITRSKFKALMSELKDREQEEIKSKVSLEWINYLDKGDLTDSEKAQCNAANSDFTQASSCVQNLKKIANSLSATEKTPLLKSTEALEHSLDYLNSFDDIEKQCMNEATLSDCQKKISLNQVELMEELEALQGVRQKILDNNSDLLLFRNFAIESLDSQQCLDQNIALKVGECAVDPVSHISPEANSLVATGIQMALVYSLPKDDASRTDVKERCESKENLTDIESTLCKLADGKAIGTLSKEDFSKGTYLAPTVPDTNQNPMRSALTQGLSNLLNTATNLFAGPPVNPYPTMPYMTPSAGRSLTVSDNIIMNARMSTGYSFNPVMSPLSSSAFFN